MQGNWNKTFVNLVNATNFQYKAILQAFDLLSTVAFGNVSDFSIIQVNSRKSAHFFNKFIKNATLLLRKSLKTLLNTAFSAGTRASASYDTIFQSLSQSLENYEFSQFVNETNCLFAEKYELHAGFLEMKWWAKKDLHKSGLIWGGFDTAARKCALLSRISESYTDSQKFFFGFVTAQLRTNWTVSLTNSVSKENFDFLQILRSLSIIAENANKSQLEPDSWNPAVRNISEIVEKVANALFPAGIFEESSRNVYDLLNLTWRLHADPQVFWGIVQKSLRNVDVATFIREKIIESSTRDNSSAGFLWEKLLQIFASSANFSETAKTLRDCDMGSKLLLSGFFIEKKLVLSVFLGFLDRTLQGDWNKTYLNLVNYTNFPYDTVLNSFVSLQNVNFSNFSLTDQYKLWVFLTNFSIF